MEDKKWITNEWFADFCLAKAGLWMLLLNLWVYGGRIGIGIEIGIKIKIEFLGLLISVW